MSEIKTDADFYIIGGGVIGLCTAMRLQSQGQSVVILEAGTVGTGASLGNAGHIATEQVFPIADPSVIKQLPSMLFDPLGPLRLDWAYLPKLFPWAIKLLLSMRDESFQRTHEALKQINGVSLSAWQNFADKWGLDKWVHTHGSLLTAESQSSLLQLKQHGEKLAALGVANDFVSQDELAEREPALASNQLGALFFPNTGHISNLEGVYKVLIAHFVGMGGVICENCKVNKIDATEQTVRLITTKGEILAPHIIISAGAFSKPLVMQATGVEVALDTERGYHLMLPNESSRLCVPVTSMDRRFIMTPMYAGLRLAGTVEFAGLKKPANMQRAYNLLKLANPMFKQNLDDSQSEPWMGFRPSTADSLPVIDKLGRVYLNFGHQHLGLTQAVISAQLISDLYFNQPSAIDRNPYKLERFGRSNIGDLIDS
ncbi:FAD-binding oxidoreductase [Moraxella haemolytica]|uniref:NAD(P)/FAD-dependent oxidoreductase n=1 Tax=Moraxella haemolytica TaxID=2904119 RepID=UPI0025436074|nr:FAD-binding oxidoreductase [Moraxella sp. ZY171148]WII95632.1 FAD-binding oxidoreductase [Moraxella sp. ZY171148]